MLEHKNTNLKLHLFLIVMNNLEKKKYNIPPYRCATYDTVYLILCFVYSRIFLS